jgi:hypothetical protein
LREIFNGSALIVAMQTVFPFGVLGEADTQGAPFRSSVNGTAIIIPHSPQKSNKKRIGHRPKTVTDLYL